jgi:hypothetical protein
MLMRFLFALCLVVGWSASAEAAPVRGDHCSINGLPSSGVLSMAGCDVNGANTLTVCHVSQDTGGDGGTPVFTFDPAGTPITINDDGPTEDGTTGQWSAVAAEKGLPAGTNWTIEVGGLTNGVQATLGCITYSQVNQTTPLGTWNIVGGNTQTVCTSGSINQDAGDYIISFLAGGDPETWAVSGGGQAIVFTNNGGSFGSAFAEDTDGVTDDIEWTWDATSGRDTCMSNELNAAAAVAARRIKVIGGGIQ